MDLVSTFSGIRQAQVAGEINTAVAKKAMDMQRQEGANVLSLLQSCQLGQVKAGDALTAAATGLGANLDVYG